MPRTRLALAALALTGAACSVPTASVVPNEPKKPEVTQAQADAQTRRVLTYLTVGNRSSAYKLLRDWSLETNCWTGMTFGRFRNLKIETRAFENMDIPDRFEVVSHLTAPVNPELSVGVIGLITAVDCDRRPTT